MNVNMNLKKNKKYHYGNFGCVGLFCNARDELNIREWAAHHLLIGFDLIYIFDHKSMVPLQKVFDHFDKRVKTQTVNWNDGNIKIPLMNLATKIAKQYSLDWFIYLDADEFLMLAPRFKGVKHFLSLYSRVDSIAINWLMFGSNYLTNEPTSGLLLENYTRSDRMLNEHVKSFVRPYAVQQCNSPHFYQMNSPQRMVGVTNQVMRQPYYFNPLNLPYTKVSAFIAHYAYQSQETYRKRKVEKMGDDGSLRPDMGNHIHALYNEVENLYPQRYIDGIKRFLSSLEPASL